MALPPFLNSVIGWLRAGYPEGVPDVDYVPLFALLGSQLSESDVKAVAEELANMSKPESAEAIRKAIAAVTDHAASDADVARVRSRLAAGGWPLAKPEHSTRRTGPNPPAGPRPARHSQHHQYFGPTNSSSRATAPRRATEMELRRE
jgi:hypothetical protein